MKTFKVLALVCIGIFILSGMTGIVSAGFGPSPFLQGRIGAIAVQLESVDDRLELVLNTIGPPAEPVPAEIMTELVSIRDTARHIAALSKPYLTGPGIPPGWTDPGRIPPMNAQAGTQSLAKRTAAIDDSMLRIDARFASILSGVDPLDQTLDDAVRLEIARVYKNAMTIANRADAYTGGTTPPPSDTPP